MCRMMIKFSDAFKIVSESAFTTAKEKIPFTESLGRALAAPVKSDMDMPPWNKSAVDGFACRQADLGSPLSVIETIAAGTFPTRAVGEGTCSRIMTGAALPEGADYVFMLEESEKLDGDRVRFTGKIGKPNYSKAAEDVRQGETLLHPGRFIRPQDIAVMAMTGSTEVTVYSRVKIGVISTGNELVEPDKTPAGAQIRNSNAWQLLAQISRTAALGKYYGIAPDDEESTTSILRKAISENDVVLISGGVSEGDYDFVPSALKKLGLKTHFDSVAVQPGKPVTFCTGDHKIVFGLPGNPVSVFVQYEVLVKPLIARMMGVKNEEPVIMLPLGTDYSRKRADRMAWIPVMLNKNGEVMPVEYHGSAHISALPDAWGMIAVPQGQSWIQKGEMVSVRSI